jgi:hypothetical protein
MVGLRGGIMWLGLPVCMLFSHNLKGTWATPTHTSGTTLPRARGNRSASAHMEACVMDPEWGG